MADDSNWIKKQTNKEGENNKFFVLLYLSVNVTYVPSIYCYVWEMKEPISSRTRYINIIEAIG